MLRKACTMLYFVALVFSLNSASAVAQSSKKGNFTVAQTVMVNGQQLPAGRYNLTWTGTGENISVTVKRGHRLVATAPARLVSVLPPKLSTVMETKNNDGSRSISEIQFPGKHYALRIEQSGSISPEQK